MLWLLKFLFDFKKKILWLSIFKKFEKYSVKADTVLYYEKFSLMLFIAASRWNE